MAQLSSGSGLPKQGNSEPRRMWKVGPGARLLTPHNQDPEDPEDPDSFPRCQYLARLTAVSTTLLGK